jgi:hypothetical protein
MVVVEQEEEAKEYGSKEVRKVRQRKKEREKITRTRRDRRGARRD